MPFDDQGQQTQYGHAVDDGVQTGHRMIMIDNDDDPVDHENGAHNHMGGNIKPAFDQHAKYGKHGQRQPHKDGDQGDIGDAAVFHDLDTGRHESQEDTQREHTQTDDQKKTGFQLEVDMGFRIGRQYPIEKFTHTTSSN